MTSEEIRPRRVSYAECLELEARTGVRHEYVGGYAYPMVEGPKPGRSDVHNLITLNLAALLSTTLSDSFDVFVHSVRIDVPDREGLASFYPDVVVTKPYRRATNVGRSDPLVVAEVVAPDTERTVRVEHFELLKQLPSLQEFVVLSQDQREVEVFRRDTGWKREVLREQDLVTLKFVGFECAVSALYRRVVLDGSRFSRQTFTKH
jgi:Uma2 family endonuclease